MRSLGTHSVMPRVRPRNSLGFQDILRLLGLLSLAGVLQLGNCRSARTAPGSQGRVRVPQGSPAVGPHGVPLVELEPAYAGDQEATKTEDMQRWDAANPAVALTVL